MKPRLRRLVELLRKELPPSLPVRVRVYRRVIVDGKPHAGAQWAIVDRKTGRPRYLNIAIARSWWPVMKDTLLHEWAHALVGDWYGEHAAHGRKWGRAMSQVYTVGVEP